MVLFIFIQQQHLKCQRLLMRFSISDKNDIINCQLYAIKKKNFF